MCTSCTAWYFRTRASSQTFREFLTQATVQEYIRIVRPRFGRKRPCMPSALQWHCAMPTRIRTNDDAREGAAPGYICVVYDIAYVCNGSSRCSNLARIDAGHDEPVLSGYIRMRGCNVRAWCAGECGCIFVRDARACLLTLMLCSMCVIAMHASAVFALCTRSLVHMHAGDITCYTACCSTGRKCRPHVQLRQKHHVSAGTHVSLQRLFPDHEE